jgi:hypothetical protein
MFPNIPEAKDEKDDIQLSDESGLHYRANYRMTRLIVSHLQYFPNILSPSHLVRRIHAIPEHMWWMIFYVLKMYLCKSQEEYFIVESFPVKAYENHKSFSIS